MAKFANLTFTSQGTQMLVQAQNSHTLTFTCGKLGSGVLADSDDISKFTDLKSPKMTLPIVSVDDSNEEKLVLTFDTSNTELEEGFVSREIGIFAKLDNGSETLYAYSNAGNNYDYIPSKDTPSDENRLVVNLVVSSSANIPVQIDKSIVYTHKSDVEEMIATHDASDTAHETRFKLFEKIADFGNDIIKKLALTTAITAITALETGSWFGQLLKMVLTASGVKYNIAQNGYVCLGSFFGGLIIQWGKLTTKVESLNVVKPNIDCTILVVIPVASFETNARSDPYPLMYATPLGSSMRILVDVDGSRLQDVGMPVDVFWFAIGTN